MASTIEPKYMHAREAYIHTDKVLNSVWRVYLPSLSPVADNSIRLLTQP